MGYYVIMEEIEQVEQEIVTMVKAWEQQLIDVERAIILLRPSQPDFQLI